MKKLPEPVFFSVPEDFRSWLEAHHESESELLVGFFKVGTGKTSLTWPESVDEALCFGWIDGIRRRIDEESYSIRFTPRKKTSTWSAVNLKRVPELLAQGRMQPAGLAAYEARHASKSRTYSYEQQKNPKLEAAAEREFRSQEGAWEFFSSQAPWYRRAATWWVVSAKREATRQRRLRQLIEDSAQSRTLKQLTRKKS